MMMERCPDDHCGTNGAVELVCASASFDALLEATAVVTNPSDCANNGSNPGTSNNFIKGCRWSPDGLCLAVSSDDGRIRLFNTPESALTTPPPGCAQAEEPRIPAAEEQSTAHWPPALEIVEGELIYDFAWHPHMNSMDPQTCVIASCSRDHPTHLWDAYTGELAATYRSYNAYDEVYAPHCLAFSPRGETLLCGFKGVTHVFDVAHPGRNYTARDTKRKHGIKGTPSCMVFADDGRAYATGYYNGQLHIFNAFNGEVTHSLAGPDGAGVTHVLFSGEHHVYVGGRKSSHIACFDLRDTRRPLLCLPRAVSTNQRMQFALTSGRTHLLTGTQGGDVLIYDLVNVAEGSSDDHRGDVNAQAPSLVHSVVSPFFSTGKPQQLLRMHTDAIAAIDTHPYLPLFATGSGKRHLPDPSVGEGDDLVSCYDNTVRLWSISQPRAMMHD